MAGFRPPPVQTTIHITYPAVCEKQRAPNLRGEVAVLHHPREPRRQERVYDGDVDLAGISLDQLQHAAELRQGSLPRQKANANVNAKPHTTPHRKTVRPSKGRAYNTRP